MFTLTTFIQRFIRSSSQRIQTRERKESYLSWKRRSTTIFVGKCDYLYRIFSDVRKVIRVNEFSKVAEYKLSMQKSIVFDLYIDKKVEI